ncbi:hypothetical protein [Paludibaculum fermentans]|uniref:hypothetical protein n=1 Tax=Paludibaculum fermentans TaxID=1473598 RepID=UPI003EBD1F4C
MNSRFILIDGKAYVWREVKMRRGQLQAQARQKQLTLFEMREDHRPEAHLTAVGRYQKPLAGFTSWGGSTIR